MIESEIIRKIKKISLNDEHRFSFLAKYIMENISLVPEITIKEMAEYSYTSVATINRFTKYLNLDGFKELIHIIKYFNYNLVNDDQLKTTKSSVSLINDIYHNIIRSIQDTFRLSLLQTETINKVIEILKNAKKINIFAVGGTFNVAQDFQYKLLRLGFNVFADHDFHSAYVLAKQSSKTDFTIIISYSGETEDLIKLANISKQNQCPILVVCKQTNNTISKIADFEFTISSNETIVRTVSTSSRLALLFALDIIYYYILLTDLSKYKEILKKTSINKF